MKRIIVALVATASLALAPQALAHPNVTGSASQVCDANKVKLTATFSNAGFDAETTVTATDSGSGVIGSGGSPATFTATFNVSDRAAGTVTFDWTTPGDSGSVVAPYDAVSGCVAPPTTTTTTTAPPPPPPKPPHIGTAVTKESPKPVAPPPAIQSGKLPFSGMETWLLAIAGLGLLGGGLWIRRMA